MHVRDACISARGSVAEKDVEGDRRRVRLAQIVGDKITGHVSAGTETCIAHGPHVAHVPERERADLRLAMAMKDTGRVKAGIENVLGDRFDTPIHRVARPQLHPPFEQIRLEVAVDLAVPSERDRPRETAVRLVVLNDADSRFAS
jgi:hypothetical protein